MGKATEDLRKEHDSILYVFKILDEMMLTYLKTAEEKLQYYSEVLYFLNIFADKCHHGKEEDYLFVELVKNGFNKAELIDPLLEEHKLGREYIALMNEAVESSNVEDFNNMAIKYRDLMIKHIAEENNVLFVKADEILSEKMQNDLFEEFEIHEEKVVGHGIHKELHGMIHKWAKDFGIEYR